MLRQREIKKRNKRNNFQIYSVILEFCRQSKRKSPIVYKCNLNFKVVDDYLRELIKWDLLNHDDPFYKTTTKGLKWAIQFNKLLELMDWDPKLWPK